MKSRKKVIYLTPDELDDLVTKREAEAQQIEAGATRQLILIDCQRLRTYAAMKRWLAPRPPGQNKLRDHSKPAGQI